MNYKTTSQLLDSLENYIDKSKISISIDNKNWKNRDCKSDLVIIDEKNNVGFEVFDNEIIVFYFTDHYHFEDYSSEYDGEEDNYIKRANDFLLELFLYRICHKEYYRGKSLCREEYGIIYDEGESICIGSTWYGLSWLKNPFVKKSSISTIFRYEKSKGCFINIPPKTPDNNAIEVIDFSDDWYIEIFEKNNVFTYVIMEKDFDEYDGRYYYYWTPSVKTAPSGFYDTKDKAVQSAIEILKHRGCD